MGRPRHRKKPSHLMTLRQLLRFDASASEAAFPYAGQQISPVIEFAPALSPNPV
jgi:hypothetical protein